MASSRERARDRLLTLPDILAVDISPADVQEVETPLSGHRPRQHGLGAPGGSEQEHATRLSSGGCSLRIFRVLLDAGHNILKLLLQLFQAPNIIPLYLYAA